MWIVKLALRKPHTTGVLCALLLFFGVFSAVRMRADVLPAIDIPAALVVWSYDGLPAEEMEANIIHNIERSYSKTVNGITRIESKSMEGVGVIKLYLDSSADFGAAIAQINSTSFTAIGGMPVGTRAPIVLPYNAGNVAVAQLTVTGRNHSEEELVDYASMGVRLRLFTIPGLATPAPFGGKDRQINVDLDPAAAAARGVSQPEVLQAVLAANPNLPGGVAHLGSTDYNVSINNNPTNLDQLRDLVVKHVGDGVVRLREVANVYDGAEAQTTIVRINGQRATYVSIIRKANASTLAVVDATKRMLPQLQKAAPDGMELHLDFDQSVFVRAAMSGVLREGFVAALLVTLLVFVALGSWRSIVIIATSIPLAICAALIGLATTGQTLNVMTLGGLSLVIGMLVDDATVEVENIHRNLALGKPLPVAILDGARQIAMPTLAATLSICVVFSPVLLLEGPARYLFVPLSLSVVFAMLASYGLSRTLVPTLALMLLRGEVATGADPRAGLHTVGERLLARLQSAYARVMTVLLAHRGFVLACGVCCVVVTGALARVVGVDFFPEVDTGLMKLHLRAPVGVSLSESERLQARVEAVIREVIPADEMQSVNATIGLPGYYNLAFAQTDSIGPQDADVLISLRAGHHPTAGYRARLRHELAARFPGVEVYFQPADIISQVLNFGLTAPIVVEVEGRKLDQTTKLARHIRDQLKLVPGAVDVRIAQPSFHPALRIDVDRERAARLGLSQQDVASNLLLSLDSSGTIAPNYWPDPESKQRYLISVQAPPTQLTNIAELDRFPVAAAGRPAGQMTPLLRDVASVQLSRSAAAFEHVNAQRLVSVDANVEGNDLGSVTRAVERIVAELGPLPAGIRVGLRGQSENLANLFGQLGLGLLVATFLAYLLMVIQFQSWIDPLIVLVAVPGALGGVLVMLAMTHTTLNVESFMGAIMAIGLAVSNSILLVSFANEVVDGWQGSLEEAVVASGRTRLRPVLMTASAMVAGMIPLALGFGEAGEQNAPLGRAVIGGLIGATLSTLFLVPTVYAMVHGRLRRRHDAELDAVLLRSES
jgi:multidrug efflux pump subunit AcrB